MLEKYVPKYRGRHAPLSFMLYRTNQTYLSHSIVKRYSACNNIDIYFNPKDGLIGLKSNHLGNLTLIKPGKGNHRLLSLMSFAKKYNIPDRTRFTFEYRDEDGVDVYRSHV